MTDPELFAQWEITEGWLREAKLRLFVSSDVADASLSKFEEYLSHNELELALDELAEAAKQSTQSDRFWDAMCQAAAYMSLSELGDAFAAQWATTRGQ